MLFDATYEWISTQGWSLVPIDPDYGGGGVEAKFSPLEANVQDYDLAWATYMGYGVSGVCWRGPRLFEGPQSKAVVKKWTAWYKRYRDTLISDALIHIRRPDGQGIDGVLHANPAGGAQEGERGLFFAYNPTLKAVRTNVSVPLYYTGIDGAAASVSHEGGAATVVAVGRDFGMVLSVDIPARGYSWWVIHGT